MHLYVTFTKCVKITLPVFYCHFETKRSLDCWLNRNKFTENEVSDFYFDKGAFVVDEDLGFTVLVNLSTLTVGSFSYFVRDCSGDSRH